MKLISVVLLAILMSSCITQKRCYERYPPVTSETVIIRDTTIYCIDTVLVPGREVAIHDTISCPELEYHKHVTSGHVTARVDIHAGKIDVDCNADSLQLLLTRERRERVITKNKSSIAAPVIERRAYWYDVLIFRPVSAIVLLLLIVWVIKDLIKTKL